MNGLYQSIHLISNISPSDSKVLSCISFIVNNIKRVTNMNEFTQIIANLCWRNQYYILEILLNRSGIDINIKLLPELHNNTHWCLLSNCVGTECVKLLLNRKDINVNLQSDTHEYTALIYYCMVQRYDIVMVLLDDSRTDIKLTNANGNTAFDIIYRKLYYDTEANIQYLFNDVYIKLREKMIKEYSREQVVEMERIIRALTA